MVTSKSIISTNDSILRRAIFEAFDGKCFYSGRNIDFVDIHIDHIIPKSRGGEDCIENYVLCSQYINLRKNAQLEKWRINIIKETVRVLFSEKVTKLYNEILCNEKIIDGMIELRHYFKENKCSQYMRNRVSSRLFSSNDISCLKINRVVNDKISHRKKILYKIEDIKRVISEYDN